MDIDFSAGAEAINGIKEGRNRLTTALIELEKQVERTKALGDSITAVKEQVAKLEKAQASVAQAVEELEQYAGALKVSVSDSLNSLDRSLDQKFNDLKSSLLSEIRAELRDTRESTRDRIDNGFRQLTSELAVMERRLIAEMPRSIFGRRGEKK